ncbi:zinc finger, CCHC-type containing protein [Tanacetum coccineum]
MAEEDALLAFSMSVVYVLTTPIHEDGENATMEQIRKRVKWYNDDYVWKGLILKGMSDPLFDIYQNVESRKELWDSLEAKYTAEDASSKKFLVSNFTNYKLTDSRPVMEQYNKLFGILERFTQHKINMDEAIQVSCTIDKLLPSWKDFKHTLKYNKEELTLVELGSHLHIEESLAALGDVHFKRMQDMSKDGLIPAFDMDTEKCKTCMLTKITKKPFQNLKRETKVLELMHGDLCNLHATPSLENKKYFVTFIDDASSRIGDHACSRGLILNGMSDPLFDIYQNVKSSKELWDSLEAKYMAENASNSDKPKSNNVAGLSVVNMVEHNNSSRLNIVNDNIGPAFMSTFKLNDSILWHARLGHKEAINDEMDSIMGNNTWVLADLPPGCKPLGCKWIFKIKLKVDETIVKFKARLVIQGFRQNSGINYFDIYAQVTRISTIRLLIAMASIYNLIIHQMDVKIGFLNGELDEEVYMNQPQGFIMPGNENKVDSTKEFLLSRFSMKDIGEVDVILGILVILINNTEENSSTSGWLFLLGDGAISWAFKKQTCITSLTMTSQFLALTAAGKEAEWLKNLLLEIPLWSKPIVPICIRCDSAATLAKSYSQLYNGKSRHLGVRHSMIHELITNGVLTIEFVRSQQNLADHLTTRLARDLVIKSAEGMGLKSK